MPAILLPTGRPDHRQEAGPEHFGQPGPGSDEQSQGGWPIPCADRLRRLLLARGKDRHLRREEVAQLAGQTLGRYKIGPLIGQGHCGMVFRARHLDDGQTLALKVLLPLFPHTDDEKQRFVRAMTSLLPLRHPNVVTVYGAGKTKPFYWIAREYVDGESMAQVVGRLRAARRTNWKRVLRVAIHIARALDFARQHHIIHRNITPHNILWHRREKVATLADLKFTKALEGSMLQLATLERKFVAELPYLSPEQAEGEDYGDDLSDIYSLGAVTYALLTGRPPFQARSPHDIITQILETAPVKPSMYQSAIPADFEHVVLNMLAKRNEDRHQTPAELLADLNAIAEEHGVRP